MVDYVAVLRRTIDALPKNTPDIRERVYAKARQTVQSKLGMINPPPSQALVARHMDALETAIFTVEADFTVAVEEDIIVSQVEADDPLADILNSMPGATERARQMAAPAFTAEAASNGDNYASSAYPSAKPAKDDYDALYGKLNDRPKLPETATLEVPETPELVQPAQRIENTFDDVFGDLPPPVLPRAVDTLPSMPSLDEPVALPQFTRPKRPQPKRASVLLPLVGLALLAGAGALAWTERERIIALLQPVQTPVIIAQPDAAVEPSTPPATPLEPAEPPVEPAVPPVVPPVTPAEPATQKFTQRLNADGTEVDAGIEAGAAGGEQSVAQLEPAAEPVTPATPAEPAAPNVEPTPAVDPAAAPETPVAPVEPAAPSEAIPVGQKAIFYEDNKYKKNII